MASRSRLIRALSPPEPVTPPPVNKRKYMGTKAFANLALSYVDEEEEVLLPIRRTPPPKSPTPSVSPVSTFELFKLFEQFRTNIHLISVSKRHLPLSILVHACPLLESLILDNHS